MMFRSSNRSSISPRGFCALVFAAASMVLGSTAQAQLTWGQTSVWVPDFSMGNDMGAINVLTYPVGAAPTVEVNGDNMHFTGDLNYSLDPFLAPASRTSTPRLLGGVPDRGNPGEFVAGGHFAAVALRTFEVGPLPIRFSASYSAAGKLFHGMGNEMTPDSSYGTGMNLYFGNITDGGINIAVTQDEFVGPGFELFEHAGESEELFLPAGQRFTLALILEVVTDVDFSENFFFPPTTITAEFGGISDYDGLRAEVQWETVPTPGAIMLAACAMPLVLRRKR